MNGATNPPAWLRPSGPAAAVLGGAGAVAASAHRAALAAVPVTLGAVVVSGSLNGLFRGRS